MAASTDLWGEIEATQIRTPLAILREQAALLGTKTKNLVEAEVNTSRSGETFNHSLELVVPALDNYTYSLLKISHGVSIYPVTWFSDGKYHRFDTEEEFIKWLGAKLSSTDTKRIVANLLAQAAA
jgi:hypothetical protein